MLSNHTRPDDIAALAVMNLQRYLRQLSYDDPAQTPPPVDGIPGSETEQALRDFQGSHGLAQTGQADAETWERLYDAYRASLSRHAPPVQVSVFPFSRPGQEEIVFRTGDSGFPVAVIQYMLRELSVDYPLPELTVDGTFGEETAGAVRAFEKVCGLPESGGVTLLLWNALADRFNALESREQ